MTKYQLRYRKALSPLLVCCAVVLPSVAFASVAFASPSGLNNIPTADTAGHREGVFQLFSTIPTDGKADHWAGFKTGVQPFGDKHRFELGFDLHVAPDESGPIVFQTKYATQPWEGLPTIGIGVANLALTSDDRDRAGQSFTYGVLTQEFEWFRAHVGYAFQHDGDTALMGLDRTVSFLGRDLMLRADCRQIDDQDQWLGSVGFLYHFHEHIALESWVSQPFDDGPTAFTFKLDFIFKF